MPKLGLGLSLPQTRVSGGSLIPAAGLSLWLKADAGVTLSGSDVTAWADQSGNDNNASSEEGTRPTFVSNTLNSKPVLRFDGAGQQMALTSSIGGTEYSIFIVCKNNDNTNGSMFFWSTDENYGKYIASITSGAYNASARNRFILSENDAGSGEGESIIAWSSAEVFNSYFVGTATQNGGGKAYSYGSGGTDSLGTFVASNTFDLIGGYEFGYELDGDVAEIISYNRAVTTPERQQVESYLTNKYNLTPPVVSRAFDSLGDQVGASNLGDIPEAWMQNQTTVTSVIFANDNSVTSIGSDAFGYCNLSGITIPNSVTDIDSFVFQYTALTNITIPNSVTSIGTAAFQNCTSLATVTIGTGVTSVSERMFQGCTSLTSITIPNSVTSIGNYAFDGCTSLATATIGTGVTSLPTQAFVSTGLTAITIPNTITSLGQESFKNCTSLASITFTAPSTLTSLGNYTFQGCTSLTSITIPPSVTSIGSYSFAFSGFTTINIPNTVTSIGEYAFKTSTSLATVTIGTGVTSVADYAFDGCTSLATVLCYVAQSALTSLGAYYTFRGTASPLTIRARSTDASWTAGTGLGFLGNANVTVIKNL